MRRVLPALCAMSLGAALALATAPARADAIDGPPACPPGTVGRSAHEGRWCVPSPCTDDSGCRDGATCRAWRVCSQTAMVVPGGLRPDDPPPEPRELAVASCPVEAACDGTGEPPPPTVGTLEGTPTCTDGRYCVPPSLPPLPSLAAPVDETAAGDPSSCLCRVTSVRAAPRVASTALVLLGLAIALRRSRRRA
jgi:hypothetical protein